MLRDTIALYTELSGNDGEHTPIVIIGAYLDGYDKGREDRPQGEWIPVSERLPDEKLFNPSGSDFGFEFEEVLCTTIWGDVRAYKFGKPIGHDKPHFWFGAGIMDEYVIAWQYKPEPYKKEKEHDEF